MHYRPFVKRVLDALPQLLISLLFADINSLRNQASFSMKRLKHYQKIYCPFCLPLLMQSSCEELTLTLTFSVLDEGVGHV